MASIQGNGQRGATPWGDIAKYGAIGTGIGALGLGIGGAVTYSDGKHFATPEEIARLLVKKEQAARTLADVLRPADPLPSDKAVRAAAVERFGNDQVIAYAVGDNGRQHPVAVQEFGGKVTADADAALRAMPSGHSNLGRVALQVADGQFVGARINNALDPYPSLYTTSQWVHVSDWNSSYSTTVHVDRATTSEFERFRPLTKGVVALETRRDTLANLGTDEENSARRQAAETARAWESAVRDADAAPKQLRAGKSLLIAAGAFGVAAAGLGAYALIGGQDG